MPSRSCILRKPDSSLLIRAEREDRVLHLEGNWYFHPDCVDRSLFHVSDRIYTCPHKGACFWVDLKSADGYINDVAWVYPDPQPKFRKIKGWFGFYSDHSHYFYSECE